MYDPGSWGSFYTALAEAGRGEVASLQSLVDSYIGRGPLGYDHSTPANVAVNCADPSVPDNLADYDAMARSVQADEPRFGQDEVYSVLTCAYWPDHGPAPAALDVTALRPSSWSEPPTIRPRPMPGRWLSNNRSPDRCC